ncbi:unnamed protein product [Gongylonema pulchrum]|uniref:Exocyst complex component 2 n=1 Tax=Gongylonema pulchrum TaxID=637853 RepID=A0A183EK12_9BILA|nr:unnamed protein product [Gongylonema pulchrum]
MTFRQNLVKFYQQTKCATFPSLFESASYEHLPNEDVSDFIKELIMCLVFIQSEVCLIAPHLTSEILSSAVQTAFDQLLIRLGRLQNLSPEQTTQIVIDTTALEESVQNFLSLGTRAVVNAFRAKLVKKLDQQSFQRSLRNFRASMRMAIASLNCDQSNANDSSDI